MENFARVIGALDEYSSFNLMQNTLTISNLNKAATFIHAGPRAGKCYKFLLFDK